MNNNLTEREKLCSYIEDIKKLETQRVILEDTIDQVTDYIDSLAIPDENIYEPEFKQAKFDGSYIFTGVILFIFGSLIASLFDSPIMTGVFFIILCITIIVPIVKYQNESSENEAKYDQLCENYLNKVKQEEQRLEEELIICERYEQQLEYLESACDNTYDSLEQLYEIGIIFEKYRYDLVAICMFSEYLNSGRCNKLEGHEGAYNIYETEIRLGVIIAKLDDIIERLDEIADTQYMLYTSLQNIQNQQERIIASLDDIAYNQTKQIQQSEAVVYNTTVLKENSNILRNYRLIDSMNKY